MKLFLKYIAQYRRTVIFFILFSFVFAVVLTLYGYMPEGVLYSFVICAIIGVIAVIPDFLRFRQRYRLMEKITEALPLMTEELPDADDLTEDELQKMIRRLCEITKEKNDQINSVKRDSQDYFTVWVHQIKTPISAMQMMLQEEDTERNRQLSAELFRIEQYAEMALHYIRLDSSSNDLVLREYELDTIIKKAIHRYAPLFIRQKLRLSYEPAEAKVLTDEKWLVFVIEQLLSNAVKYTSKGCVTLKYDNGILSVSDTGIGIAAEDLPRIFEKGYTGLSGRENEKSTGLGLYLCRKACEKLGHRIYAGSKPGSGTTVYLDLRSEKLDIE